MILLALIVTILGIAYILSPIDIIPDFIPFLGWTDDFLVLIVILFTWVVTLGVLTVQALYPILKILLVITGLIILIKYLSKNKK